jgi:hypothetical protein
MHIAKGGSERVSVIGVEIVIKTRRDINIDIRRGSRWTKINFRR